MSNINKMIDSVKSATPNDFMKSFTSEVNSRVSEAISLKRQEVVGKMFGVTESLISEEEMVKCPKCGKMVEKGTKCPNCDTKVE